MTERAGREARHPPARSPPSPTRQPTFDTVSRKPIVAGDAEVAANPRARSAKLRVVERTAAPCRSPEPETAAGRIEKGRVALMGRFFHVAAILALIGSALLRLPDQVRHDLSRRAGGQAQRPDRAREDRNRGAAGGVAARQPADRIQALADKHSDLVPASINQSVRWQDIPNRPAPSDGIGAKLEALGLLAPTNTPSGKAGDARTPTSRKP